MGSPLQFKIKNSNGSDNTTTAPTIAAWLDKATSPQSPGSSAFTHMGSGVWELTPTDGDQTAGRAYVIDTGSRIPAVFSGTIHAPGDPFYAALWSQPDGSGPWTGTTLTGLAFDFYKNPANVAQTQPSILTGGYSGHTKCLSLVLPSSGDKTGGIIGEISGPSAALAQSQPFAFKAEGSSGSTTVPTVSNFTPALPGPIQPGDTVQFDVTCSDGTAFAIITIMAILVGTDEVESVYDGASYETLFSQSSSINTITNGFRFILKRRGGWPVNVKIKIRAVTASGQINA